jgi:Rieske 2Fe-2S family protein
LEGAGECFIAEHGTNRLLIVRDETGQIRCFRNVCRHRGSLIKTDPNDCQRSGVRLQCPYHGWTYDRTGALVSAPNMTDVPGFDHDQFALHQLECRTGCGFVFVRLSPDPGNFDEFFAPLMASLKPWPIENLITVRRMDYAVEANWKLIFQNYSECYHCPTVHPALNRLTPYLGSKNEFSEGAILGGPMQLADDCRSMSTDGRAVGHIFPQLNEEIRRCVAYYTVFPTMFISTHPDYVMIHRLVPRDVDQTEVICEFLFSRESVEDPEFDPAPAVEFWDQTNRQDWRVCESTQRGMSSDGYSPGPYSNLESIVAAFDRFYLDMMG